MRIFNLLCLYIRDKFKTMVALAAAIITMSGVMWLYNGNREAIIYGLQLVLLTAIVMFIVGFILFRKKYMELVEMEKNIVEVRKEMPSASGTIEMEYQKLITILWEGKNAKLDEQKTAMKDMADYYAIWAHQIKTPIAAMSLMLQLDNSNSSAEYQEQLFKIEQYVEMVLTYIRAEGMTSDLVLKKYNLDDIVRPAVRKYSKLFIRKKIRLEYDQLDCNVVTDQKWMEFVIEQILSNAIKYTDKGSIFIKMSTDRSELIIADQGIGIAGEDLPRVFENGFTGYNGRSNKKSTGIGLYLCKKVLTKLGHRIRIESEPGKGTTVYISIATS